MDNFTIDRFAGGGRSNRTKSFSPYGAVEAKEGSSELLDAMKSVQLMRDRARRMNEDSSRDMAMQRLVERANEAKRQAEAPPMQAPIVIGKKDEKKATPPPPQPAKEEPKKEAPPQAPAETDEQIAKRVEMAKKANENAKGLTTGSSTEDILTAALNDLF